MYDFIVTEQVELWYVGLAFVASVPVRTKSEN